MVPGGPGMPPVVGVPGVPSTPIPGVPQGPVPGVPSAPIPRVPGGSSMPDMSGLPNVASIADMSGLPNVSSLHFNHPAPPSQSASAGGTHTPGAEDNDIAVDPSLEDADNDDESEEPVVKRQRLQSQGPSLEDEAMMNALAAHNSRSAGENYGNE